MTEPTNIADAITAAQGRVADCYTAISNKGGTLPQTQNLANMPTAINSISGGGGVNNTSLSVTPSTSSQSFTPTAPYTGYSPVTVNAVDSSIDSNIQAENIKNGVSILGVSGTYTGSGGSSTKYGVSIDNMLGSVNSDGVLQLPDNTAGDIVFTGVKDLSDYALFYKFYRDSNLACSVSFPDLETISGVQGLYYSFWLTHITSVSLPKLKTVSGNYALSYAFSKTNITSLSLPELETVSGSSSLRNLCTDCSYITSVSLPKLKTISSYGIAGLVQNAKITTISLPELETVTGTYALQGLCSSCKLLETAYFAKLSTVSYAYVFSGTFIGCSSITDIYFNALTTTSFGTVKNQFNGMFNNNASSGTAATSGNVNVHFPSNLETTISGLTGYPLFGGPSGRVTLLFDLPATS